MLNRHAMSCLDSRLKIIRKKKGNLEHAHTKAREKASIHTSMHRFNKRAGGIENVLHST